MSERLNFEIDVPARTPRVRVPMWIWDGLHQIDNRVSAAVDSIIGLSDASPLIVRREDSAFSVEFNFKAVGGLMQSADDRDRVLKNTILFINGLHRAAGPGGVDPYFMAEGSIVPANRGKYALRSSVIFPRNVPHKELEKVVYDQMDLTKRQLQWGNPANDDISCTLMPGTKVELSTAVAGKPELFASNKTRPTQHGQQMIFASESLSSLDQSVICLMGGLAIAKAHMLAQNHK